MILIVPPVFLFSVLIFLLNIDVEQFDSFWSTKIIYKLLLDLVREQSEFIKGSIEH